jgi:putative ABC transport system permease protein
MEEIKPNPPNLFLRFFRWYCHPRLTDHIEGDLIEVYRKRVRKKGKRKADIRFVIDVLLLFRPGIIRPAEGYKNLNNYGMYKSYFKVGWRKLVRDKGYSFINIGGLAAGMTVAILIGLWIYDELSFNKYHKNYDSIAQIWRGGIDPATSTIEGGHAVQYPLAPVLRTEYQRYFKHAVRAWWVGDFTLAVGENRVLKTGHFIEDGAIEMLSLQMIQGSNQSLVDPYSIILSKSTAKAIFGKEDPMHKTVMIDNTAEVQVTGVYEDIAKNSRFGAVQFFAPWAMIEELQPNLKNAQTDWDNNNLMVFVQLRPGVTVGEANAAIKDLYYKSMPKDFLATVDKYKPFVKLIPMNTWHLYSEFENGEPAGGRITFVWLFGVVGAFVLLLACINFMNLTTAQSEKRSREVGVRKVIGSARQQLVTQFLSESFIVVIFAFLVSIILIVLLQPWFNRLTEKDISLPFGNPVFWALAGGFVMLTGFLAGAYPALYLSSFQPARVLKGVFHFGRFATLPRKLLVVVQFTVSVVLIFGTLVVYQQVQFARNRPVGYDRNGLITIGMNDPEYRGKEEFLRTQLLSSGVVSDVAFSSSPMTAIWNTTGGYEWKGKDPNLDAEFARCKVTPEYGKTVGWKVIAGRDFSRDYATDSTDAVIISKTAAAYMGMVDAVGQTLTDVDEFGKHKWTRTIIGVVDDIIMDSPYEPVMQAIFLPDDGNKTLLHVRISPDRSASEALPVIEALLNKIVPSALFEYKFVDEEYAAKFSQEQRVGVLAGIFAVLAIFISCLGLFGLASFVAERRTKEIGIRKVMGASVSNIWKMLSKDFVVLVSISCLIAIPMAYYLLVAWLKQYEYRTGISWWIFAVTCLTALVFTLLTVSYQAVRAALMKPVNSLRSE